MCAFRTSMMRDAAFLTLCVAVGLLLSFSQAARQGQDIRCGGLLFYLSSLRTSHVRLMVLSSACRALVDEMDWAISQIDPKKMIQTGSFRINPDGSQSIREVRHQLCISLHLNKMSSGSLNQCLMVFSFLLISSGFRFLWLALRETSWS